MRRVTPRVWVAVLPGVSLGAVLFAQAALSGQGFGATQRDGPPPPPAVRRIPIGTSTISGTVTAADTGKPIRGARVSVGGTAGAPGAARGAALGGAPGVVIGGSTAVAPVGPGGVTPLGRGGVPLAVAAGLSGTGLSRTALTDASGQFSFERLPAGQFTLNVFQSQFLQTAYGQKRPGGQGTAIRLGDGEQLNLKIQMMRGGVITGTVFGEDGEPQRGAEACGVRPAAALGLNPRPGDREAIAGEIHRAQQGDVVAIAVIGVAGLVARFAAFDATGRVGEAVPDRLALAVFARRALDLVGRSGGAPMEAVREIDSSQGPAMLARRG